MKDEQGNKIKAKNMTRRQALLYLDKILKGIKGKKRRRAMEIAITGMEQLVGPREVGKAANQ